MEGINLENIPQPDLNINIKTIFGKVVWTDVPIIATIVIYVVLLLIALKIRKNKTKRTIMFAGCLLYVTLVERITEVLGKNWEKLGFSENYFDDFGVFAAFFYALPPLFIAIILFSTLIGSIADKLIQRHYYNKQQEIAAKEEEKKEKKPEEEEKEEKKEEEDKEEGKLE